MTQADAHDHSAHPPYLAHHFDTPRQQFEASKLGMWIFLATEILMFGGLFCAYAVYRATHPEIFLYAHHYLDTNWGAINTAVLLVSSFTMAWGVRAAQLGQKTLLVAMLVLTLMGAFGFMVIKAIEYDAKFSHDLGPGLSNLFTPDSTQNRADHLGHLEHEYGLGAHGADHADEGDAGHGEVLHEGTSVAEAAQAQDTTVNPHEATLAPADTPADQSLIAPAAQAPSGTHPGLIRAEPLPADGSHGVYSYDELSPPQKSRVHIFFQIYFLMTGLHGIHVTIGIGLIVWLLIRSIKGHFGPSYFTPVDIVGLYWHLVDLIWIFLFPLLYLIH